jgi:hypothetical protein
MGIEVRQLLYQKQFLILFTLQNLEEEQGSVYIHRVRHGSKQRLENIQDLLGDEL